MSCGELFLKSASSTFTGYFLIVSIAFILYGLTTTYYLLQSNSAETLGEEFVSVPSLCLVLFGFILFLIIMMGCCAICREIPCCLETYSICLAVLATAQLGLGIFCLLHFTTGNTDLQRRMYDAVDKMFAEYESDPRQMDTTQKWIKCCGVGDFGPKDWLHNRSIPLSCCDELSESCSISSEELYQDGCFEKLFSFIVATNQIIGLALIATGFTEMVGSLMGIGLSCAFWRRSRFMWI